MKILHLIDSGGLYGAEVMLLHLMEEQVRLGLQPILASIGNPGVKEKPIEAEASRRGLRVEKFRMLPGPNWLGAFDVLRFARKQQTEVLHSHGYKGNILFGLLPKRLRGLSMVATLHGYTCTSGLSKMMIYEWLDSLSLRFIDRVVLVNEAMKEHPRLQNRRGLNLTVIENGIPVTNHASECASDMLRQDILAFARQGSSVVAVGRLSNEKGFEYLIQAVADLVSEGRDLRLVILGDGALRGVLQYKIDQLGLSQRVFMPGYVERAEAYLKHFDVFAMPSLTEGLPMVLLEAMAAAVPVVASRVGGIPEMLDHGKAGLLTDPGNVSSLKFTLREIKDSPQAALHRSAVAETRVREIYSSRVMAERYAETYRFRLQVKPFK